MNNIDIQTFLEIVKSGNMSTAAETLYTSQSTISQRLNHLEEELGITLIIRGKGLHTFELTSAGKQFTRIANNWLSLYEDTQNLKYEGIRYKLSIASVEWINIYTFGQVFNDFAIATPNVEMQIYSRHSPDVYRMLANHEADVGFVVRPFQYKGIRTTALFSEEMFLVCAKDSFEKGKKVHPSELDPALELRWNFIPEYSAWHDKWFDLFTMPRLRLDSASMIFNFLGDKGRWTIVPKSVVDYFKTRNDISTYQLSAPAPKLVYYKLESIHPRASRLSAIDLFNEFFQTKIK